MFSVLGAVRAGAGPVEGQIRRLLGILLADGRAAISTEAIADRLWLDDLPPTAETSVHVAIGRLRRCLEPTLRSGRASRYVITIADGYRLDCGETDLDHYERLVADAETLADREPERALELVDAAIAMWARPWGEQADEPWLALRVLALEERHRRVEEQWADLALRTGRQLDTIERLMAAAEREPLREQRWQQLILCLYRAGRQADALQAYEHARRELDAAIGIAPGPELERLQLAVLEQDPVLKARPGSDSASTVGRFVGRRREVEWLAEAFATSRLVTIVGMGGLGKTRLATEYAQRRRLAGDLATIVTFGSGIPGDRVARHLARALHLDADTDEAEARQLAFAVLGQRQALVVLDEVEVCADEVTSLALGLLERCPRLQLLVTSRVPLGLANETALTLDPLPIGSANGPIEGTALEMLIDVAELTSIGLDNTALHRLERHCVRTGGVPLLVELFGVNAREVATGTGEPDSTTPVSANITVRDAIANAMDLVDDNARRLLVASAALPDGVCAETALRLSGLTEPGNGRALKHLTWARLMTTAPGRASLRYRSLDPIREALTAEMGSVERETAIDRACGVIREVFTSIEPDPLQGIVVSRLDCAEDEQDNLRHLFLDRMAADPRTALELAIAGSLLWSIRGGAVEGRRWLEEALAASAPGGELLWRATLALARTVRHFGEVAQLEPQLRRAVTEMRAVGYQGPTYFCVLGHLAAATGWNGDRVAAAEMLDEGEALLPTVGTPWARVQLGKLRSLDRALAGDLIGARDAQRDYARQFLELGDTVDAQNSFYLAAALGDMAGLDDCTTDIATALQMAAKHRDVRQLGQLLLLQARAVQRTGDPNGVDLLSDAAEQLERLGGVRAAALARRDIGLHYLDAGDTTAAAKELRRSLPLLLQLDTHASAVAAAGLAVIAHTNHDTRRAEGLAASAVALRSSNAPAAPEDARQLMKLLDAAGYSRSAELGPTTRPADETVLALADVS